MIKLLESIRTNSTLITIRDFLKKYVINESFYKRFVEGKLLDLIMTPHYKKSKKIFQKTHPKVPYIFGKKHYKGHSQCGQDIFVYDTFFKGKKNGVCFEIGASVPFEINNSLLFEEIGWTCYAFDPQPNLEEQWHKHRKAKFFPYAITSQPKKYHLYVDNSKKGKDMAGYIPSKTAHHKPSDMDNRKQIEVNGIPLKNILQQEEISEIDYMSIDVEGYEIEVLKGIDFESTKIDVLTIENCNPGYEEVRQFMQARGYVFYAYIYGVDDVFVHKSFLDSQ